MSLIEAIPTHMRQTLLEELQQWAALKEEIKERIDSSREAELAHLRHCLENNLPLTADNLSVGMENLQEDADSGAMVSLKENEPLKQS